MSVNGPILHLWSTGELKRECRHVGGKEAMVIRRPLEPGACPVVILLENMHYYYPMDEYEFMENSPLYTALAVGHLKLPVGYSPTDLERTLRRFVDFVQDGFDDLKKMRPEGRQKEAVGEFSAVIGGEKITGEVTE